MANPGYVRSTDGDNADNGSTWALANATLAVAMTDQSAGDRIWVSDNHAESQASAMTITFKGTLASPNQVLCGDDSAEPPTSFASTGTITTTGTSNLTIDGTAYVYGLTFSAGTGTSATNLLLGAAATNIVQMYEACTFILGTTVTASSHFKLGDDNNVQREFVFKDCTFKFGAVGQHIQARHGKAVFQGGGIASGSATLSTALFQLSSEFRGSVVWMNGVDLSLLGTSCPLVSVGSTRNAFTARFRNCKLPASWSGTLTTGSFSSQGVRVEMLNCSAGDFNYHLWVEDYAGSIKHETALVKTGGASDGTTPISWQMATSANAEYPAILLRSPEIAKWNETTGSAVTLTVDFMHFAQGAGTSGAMQNNEIWIEVESLGTASFPLSKFDDDAVADVVTTAADQDTSTASWDGGSAVGTYSAATNYAVGAVVKPSTPNGAVYLCTVDAGTTAAEPTWGTTDGGSTVDAAGRTWVRCNRQKVHLTLASNPALKGLIIARVCVAKASIAAGRLYIDPELQVS